MWHALGQMNPPKMLFRINIKVPQLYDALMELKNSLAEL